MDKVSVREIDNKVFEIELGDNELKTLSEHAEQCKMSLDDYLVSIIKDYIEVLEENLND